MHHITQRMVLQDMSLTTSSTFSICLADLLLWNCNKLYKVLEAEPAADILQAARPSCCQINCVKAMMEASKYYSE